MSEISAIGSSSAGKILVTAMDVATAVEKSVPDNNAKDVAEKAIKDRLPSLGIGQRLNTLG